MVFLLDQKEEDSDLNPQEFTFNERDRPEKRVDQDVQVKMHEGEILIDLALVKRLLNEQFPRLAGKPITVVRSIGTVNAIYRVGNELCLRLPRLEKWADSIHHEWTWLPKIAAHLSLDIPKPFALGKPAHYFPLPWAIYHWIEGGPFQDELIKNDRQAAQDLAGFILELRGMDAFRAPAGGRRPLAELDAATRSVIDSCRSFIDTKAVFAAWTQSLASVPWDGRPVWIHGDIIRPNLLVRDGRLGAILDFGGTGIGDPAADIIAAWSVFNRAARDVFRAALNVDEDTWCRSRGYALHQALLIIPYYLKTNPEFVRMAKRTVNEILAD